MACKQLSIMLAVVALENVKQKTIVRAYRSGFAKIDLWHRSILLILRLRTFYCRQIVTTARCGHLLLDIQ